MNNDGFTLLTLLRGKVLNYDPNWLRLAVPRNNFNLIQETVEALITAIDFDSALKLALETYYARYVVRLASPEETIANSEKTFKNAVLQHAKSSRITENFDIGAPLAFITQREAEVHNLVAIGLGVEAAMKPAEIQSQLSF